MAKCKRNVENFLEACRRLGVPQVSETAVLNSSLTCSLLKLLELQLELFTLEC